MMYHYYSNKDELFLRCVEDTFNALKEYVVQHKDRLNSPDIPERIRDYFMLREYFFQLDPKRKQIFETAMLHPPSICAGRSRHCVSRCAGLIRRFWNRQSIPGFSVRAWIGNG